MELQNMPFPKYCVTFTVVKQLPGGNKSNWIFFLSSGFIAYLRGLYSNFHHASLEIQFVRTKPVV